MNAELYDTRGIPAVDLVAAQQHRRADAHGQTAGWLPLSGCPRSRKGCSTRARGWLARPGPPPPGSRRDTARGSRPPVRAPTSGPAGRRPARVRLAPAVPVRVRRESRRRARPQRDDGRDQHCRERNGDQPGSVARHRRHRERSGHEHDEERQRHTRPTTLALCATGSTVVCVYPTSAQGKPPKNSVRASSVATHAAGESRSPRAPNRRTATATAAANAAGKSDRYPTSRPAMPPESTGLMPPYCDITPLVQYRVPPKYSAPAARPSAQARRRPPRSGATSVSATRSGARAIQETAGCPKRGKLSASSRPDASERIRGSTSSTDGHQGLLARHPRLELLVLPQSGRNPVGLAAALEASHLHPVDGRLARLRNEHVRLVALRHEPLARSRRPRRAHARRRVERHTPTDGRRALGHRRWSGSGRRSRAHRRSSLPADARAAWAVQRRDAPSGCRRWCPSGSSTRVVVVVVVCCRLGRRLVRRRRGRLLLRWRRCLLRLLRFLTGAPGANRLGSWHVRGVDSAGRRRQAWSRPARWRATVRPVGHAAADHHAAKEDDDRHNGRGHEQEDQLLPVQLNLVKTFVAHVSVAAWGITASVTPRARPVTAPATAREICARSPSRGSSRALVRPRGAQPRHP